MTEKDVEAYLREQVKALGGKAYKFVSPGNSGVPDRMVCLPGGRVIFVELKAPGKTSTALQKCKRRELAKMNFVVYADICTKAQVDLILAGYGGGVK